MESRNYKQTKFSMVLVGCKEDNITWMIECGFGVLNFCIELWRECLSFFPRNHTCIFHLFLCHQEHLYNNVADKKVVRGRCRGN